MLFLLALGIALPARAQPVAPAIPGPAEVVAVLPFEPVGASLVEVSAATDRLQEELLETGKVVVVDRSRIEAVLKEQRLQHARCIETECAAQIGKLLNARKLVIGKITRLDDTHWQISARVVDVETARIVRAPSVLHEGTIFDFLRWGMRGLADRIAEPPDSMEVSNQPAGGGGPQPQAIAGASELQPREASPPPAQPKGDSAVSVSKPADPARAPRSGWAVFGGIVSRSGTLRRDQGGKISYGATGIEVGGAYHWAISPHWTVGVIVAGGGGDTGGEMSRYYKETDCGLRGGQVRYWSSSGAYLGVELGIYDTKFISPHDQLTMEGNGAGAVAGFRWPSGGFMDVTWTQVTLRSDRSASPSYFSGTATEERIKLSFGYQW